MINSKVKHHVEKTLDLADHSMSPKTWTKWPRRIYLVLLPLSWPLLSLWSMIVMFLVISSILFCGVGVLWFLFKDYCADLWRGGEP